MRAQARITEQHTRPAAVEMARSRLACALVRASASIRQPHVDAVPGVFMRASEPSPSTSCKGKSAVFATDESASRMKSQCGSRPSLAPPARCRSVV